MTGPRERGRPRPVSMWQAACDPRDEDRHGRDGWRIPKTDPAHPAHPGGAVRLLGALLASLERLERGPA